MIAAPLFMQRPSVALALLNEVFQEVSPSLTAELLGRSLHCLEPYEGYSPFRNSVALIRRAVRSGDVELQRQGVGIIRDTELLKYPLAAHAESLAEAVGFKDRSQELQAVVGHPRTNPFPWWFAAKYLPQSPTRGLIARAVSKIFSSRVEAAPKRTAPIPFSQGALAIGRTQALKWLVAYREVLETSRLPEGFSKEPYLLWIPDELYQTALLNSQGGYVQEVSDEFVLVNSPGKVRIRALLPFLGPEDHFAVDRDMKSAGDMELGPFFQAKYRTVRRHDIRSAKRCSPMTEWALQAFQHQMRTMASSAYLAANEAIRGMADPWLSYDLSAGGFPTPDVMIPWRDIEGLRVFIRGQPRTGMETGVYDQNVRRVGEGIPSEIETFYETLTATLREREMPKPVSRPEPPAPSRLPFEDTLPSDQSEDASEDALDLLQARFDLVSIEIGKTDEDDIVRLLELRGRADAIQEKIRSLEVSLGSESTPENAND